MNAKERPILFSGTMVRALLAGTKTQTRRIVKPQPMPDVEFVREHEPEVYGHGAFCAFRQDGRVLMHQRMAPCPYGQPGDRLWVKETWSTGARLDGMSPSDIERKCRDAGYTHGACCPVRYHADGRLTQWGDRDADDFGPQGKTRVSIHMPRWASRLTLEIVSVRVERLTSISEADAIAEGITYSNNFEGFHTEECRHFHGRDPRKSYEKLWDSINGPESWEANPWVWVVEFRRVES